MSETTAHTAPRVRREPCERVCVSAADAEAQHCTYARQRGTERVREQALFNQTTETQSLAVAPRQQNEGKEGENSVKQWTKASKHTECTRIWEKVLGFAFGFGWVC